MFGSSRGELRQLLYDLRATGSTGSKSEARANRAINLALKQFAADVPNALIPDEEHVVLYTDVNSGDTNVDATVQATTDQHVLEFRTSAGAVLSSWTPTVDGRWDGIMHLEVQDPDDTTLWHRFQSREWWSETDTDTKYYVSLDRKWKDTSSTGMNFRIYQKHFYMPGDVLQILEPARIWGDSQQMLRQVAPHEGYARDLKDYRGEKKGEPLIFWRDGSFKPGRDMLQPTTAPTLTFTGSWVGPEQEGDFEIFYTYVWGKQDLLWQGNPGGDVVKPIWESPPSPAAVTNQGAFSGSGLRMTASNPDEMLNFDIAGTKREGRTGLRVRFYVRRTALYSGGAGSYNNTDADSIAYLLAEVDPAEVNPVASYTWTGTRVPDRLVRHYPVNGYYAYSVYPTPDSRHEIDFRVLRMPIELSHDQDTIPIQQDAHPCFQELCLAWFCRMDAVDMQASAFHMTEYERQLPTIRDRYENPARTVEQRPWNARRFKYHEGQFFEN